MIWYCLMVPPMKEFAVERLLTEVGYAVFVPIGHRARFTHRKAKRKVIVASTQFPGYIFIGFDPGPIAWADVMRFKVIHGVLGHDGEPLPLTDADMHKVFNLNQRVIPYIQNRQAKRKKQKGYEAKIISGPFTDRKVRVIEVNGRIEALYELFQQRSAV